MSSSFSTWLILTNGIRSFTRHQLVKNRQRDNNPACCGPDDTVFHSRGLLDETIR